MQGEDVLVKRTTLEKYSQTYYPQFTNDGTQTYILCYDPSSRQDNSCVLAAELIRDEKKGLMLKISNVHVLVEQTKNGQIAVMQKPQQLEVFKHMMIDYNWGYDDYYGLDSIHIDAGSGGGGFEIGQYLLNDFTGYEGKTHRGIIDLNNEYMKIRADDYAGAAQILTMANFKRDKTAMYEAASKALNQGLVIWPKSLNIRNELEFEVTNADGSLSIRYEKPNLRELNALIQIELTKEELMGIQRVKKPNGTFVFEATPEAKQVNMHDDRADCIAMACYRLMELRNDEALNVEQKPSDFHKIFERSYKKNKNDHFGNGQNNPFYDKMRRVL